MNRMRKNDKQAQIKKAKTTPAKSEMPVGKQRMASFQKSGGKTPKKSKKKSQPDASSKSCNVSSTVFQS